MCSRQGSKRGHTNAGASPSSWSGCSASFRRIGAGVALLRGAAGERDGQQHVLARLAREQAEVSRQTGVERGEHARVTERFQPIGHDVAFLTPSSARDSASTVRSSGKSKKTPVAGPRSQDMPRRKR